MWYFKELLFIVEQDTPDQSKSALDEKNEAMTGESTVSLLREWATETHCSINLCNYLEQFGCTF
jgi:hypothetical protein